MADKSFTLAATSSRPDNGLTSSAGDCKNLLKFRKGPMLTTATLASGCFASTSRNTRVASGAVSLLS
jgi:hypothetical protein